MQRRGAPDLIRVGWMEWRDLVFLHWPVEPRLLAEHVPAGLELDEHDGAAWLSIVAFRMVAAPALIPRAFAIETPEVNVRTYVRSPSGARGIYFLSLDVGSWAATLGARLGLGLPYFAASCDHQRVGSLVNFASERALSSAGRFDVTVDPSPVAGRARPGSADHFLAERYALYVDRPGVMLRVQVHHAPYLLQTARVVRLAHDLFSTDGIGILDGTPPQIAHYCQGVDVEVFRPELVGHFVSSRILESQ